MIILSYERPERKDGQRTGNYTEHRSEVKANVTVEQAIWFVKMTYPDAQNVKVVSDGTKS